MSFVIPRHSTDVKLQFGPLNGCSCAALEVLISEHTLLGDEAAPRLALWARFGVVVWTCSSPLASTVCDAISDLCEPRVSLPVVVYQSHVYQAGIQLEQC
jgi:hypothetical protein